MIRNSFSILLLLTIVSISRPQKQIIEPEMILVAGGDKIIRLENGDEKKISVSDFYIAKYETTVSQFKQYIEYYSTETGFSANQIFSDTLSNYPINMISFLEAQEFTLWLSAITGEDYRLPTEEEWLYAALCGMTDFNEFDKIGWNKKNSNGRIYRIGLKEADAAGLYDMSGNVSEFVELCESEEAELEAKIMGGSFEDEPGKPEKLIKTFNIFDKGAGVGFRLAKDK